jgi:hypothetical protein
LETLTAPSSSLQPSPWHLLRPSPGGRPARGPASAVRSPGGAGGDLRPRRREARLPGHGTGAWAAAGPGAAVPVPDEARLPGQALAASARRGRAAPRQLGCPARVRGAPAARQPGQALAASATHRMREAPWRLGAWLPCVELSAASCGSRSRCGHVVQPGHGSARRGRSPAARPRPGAWARHRCGRSRGSPTTAARGRGPSDLARARPPGGSAGSVPAAARPEVASGAQPSPCAGAHPWHGLDHRANRTCGPSKTTVVRFLACIPCLGVVPPRSGPRHECKDEKWLIGIVPTVLGSLSPVKICASMTAGRGSMAFGFRLLFSCSYEQSADNVL